jgi:hypothetical protein
MTARKSTPKKAAAPISGAALAEIVEKVATGPAGGTALITVASGPRALKSAADRIRRLPRLKGWKAVTVKATDERTETTVTLEVTSTGKMATPWPQRDATAAEPTTRTSSTTAKRSGRSAAA